MTNQNDNSSRMSVQTPSTATSSSTTSNPSKGGSSGKPGSVQFLDVSQIKTGMPVYCSKNTQFGVVDHMEGKASIKLNKDQAGLHHYIPVTWVTRVDQQVHIDRPGEQAMREWTKTPIA